jgi:voltage-gated potassium channel Kch
MIARLAAGFGVMALCVVVHAVGVTRALRWLRSWVRQGHTAALTIRLLIVVAVWVLLLHLVEIAAWAALYLWSGAIADLASALYFSAVTYTTTGYGDIVLPQSWRIDGAMEALTGILMCGWSTGFFFAVVSRFHEPPGRRRDLDPGTPSAAQSRGDT